MPPGCHFSLGDPALGRAIHSSGHIPALMCHLSVRDMKPGTGPVAGCDGSSFNVTQPGAMRDEGFSARLSRVDWHVGGPVG